MKKLQRIRSAFFWSALGLSVGFPCGIVMIVFGASGKIWPLLILGILLAVAGFYCMPILWIRFADCGFTVRLVHAVTNQNLYTVSDLSAYLGKNEKQISTAVTSALSKGYLEGFLFTDGVLRLNRNARQTIGTFVFRCSSCGAQVEAAENATDARCEYCGTRFDREAMVHLCSEQDPGQAD